MGDQGISDCVSDEIGYKTSCLDRVNMTKICLLSVTLQMDRGGPLVSIVSSRWYLAGLASKTSCGVSADVFTKMSEMYEWIAPIFDGRNPLSKYTSIAVTVILLLINIWSVACYSERHTGCSNNLFGAPISVIIFQVDNPISKSG